MTDKTGAKFATGEMPVNSHFVGETGTSRLPELLQIAGTSRSLRGTTCIALRYQPLFWHWFLFYRFQRLRTAEGSMQRGATTIARLATITATGEVRVPLHSARIHFVAT